MKKMFLLALAATTVFISCNKQEIENLEIRNAHLTAVNEGLTQAAADLQGALAAANDDISMLELVIDTANESIAKLDADNAAQAVLIADYEASIEAAEARIVELEDELATAEALIEELQTRVQDLIDNPTVVEVTRTLEVIRNVIQIVEVPVDGTQLIQDALDAANQALAEANGSISDLQGILDTVKQVRNDFIGLDNADLARAIDTFIDALEARIEADYVLPSAFTREANVITHTESGWTLDVVDERISDDAIYNPATDQDLHFENGGSIEQGVLFLLAYLANNVDAGTVSGTVTFSDWTPAASADQTADYTQTRTGDDGSTESRDVIVTSNSVSNEITEEAAQVDLNDDGDLADTFNRTQTQYIHNVDGQSIFISGNNVEDALVSDLEGPEGPDAPDVWNVDGTQGGESLGVTNNGEESAPIFRYNGVDYASDGAVKAAIALAGSPAGDYTYQRIHTQPTIETFGELFENEVYVVNGDNDGNGFAAGDTRQGASLGIPDAVEDSVETSTDITYNFPGVQADPADVWTISTSGLGGELLSSSDSSSAVYFFNGQNYLSLAAVTDAVNAANPNVDIDVDVTGTLTDATIEVYADAYDEETLTVNGQPDVAGTATGDVRRVNQVSIPNGITSDSTPTTATIEVRNAPAAAWVVTDGIYTHAGYPGYSFTVSPASFPLTGFLATFTVPAGEETISNLGHANEDTLIANAKSAIEKIND